MGMPRELFEVQCPCCQSSLKVDPELRAVIAHEEPVKPPPSKTWLQRWRN